MRLWEIENGIGCCSISIFKNQEVHFGGGIENDVDITASVEDAETIRLKLGNMGIVVVLTLTRCAKYYV